ncbi:MAG: phosphotransferase family protein [bacterium]|nr:phosphotransferase family protein [bacterium]
MAEPDVPGVDLEKVSAFFAKHVPGAGLPLRFEMISGGRSNLTYAVFGADGQRYVLRRPPLGHVLPTAHDMAREYRVLSGLAKTRVPAPRPFALCEDSEVNGAPFYVMDFREGHVLQDSIPEGYAESPEERLSLCSGIIDALVELHGVDYRAVGLADFGRPDGYLERQVRRWSQQWERSKTRELTEIDELIRRLNGALPQNSENTIVHGDYRLGNMALDPTDPGRIVAIFDWEMSTLGDPLSDLGYLLIYWLEADDPEEVLRSDPISAIVAKPGFMTRDELAQEYARRSGRDISKLDFYRVLATYKLAVISEGIHARFLKGKTVGEGFSFAGQAAERLAHRALALADQSNDASLRG